MPELDSFHRAEKEKRERESAEAAPKMKLVLDEHKKYPQTLEDVFEDVDAAKADAWSLSKRDNLKD